jgi:hypothetical protein
MPYPATLTRLPQTRARIRNIVPAILEPARLGFAVRWAGDGFTIAAGMVRRS